MNGDKGRIERFQRDIHKAKEEISFQERVIEMYERDIEQIRFIAKEERKKKKALNKKRKR